MKLGFSIGIRTFAFLTALMGCSSLPLKREPASPAVFFPQEACATIQEHYILPLEKFLAAKNVWPSIPFDKVGFVFRDESNDRHWLYGYSPNELSRLQIPFKICAENQKVLIVEPKIPFFKEDSVFTYGFPVGWAPFPTEWKSLYLPVHPLVRSTNRMFFGLRLPLVDPALKPRSKTWDWKEESAKVSSVMIHEIFHGLQFRRFKGFSATGSQMLTTTSALASPIRIFVQLCRRSSKIGIITFSIRKKAWIRKKSVFWPAGFLGDGWRAKKSDPKSLSVGRESRFTKELKERRTISKRR